GARRTEDRRPLHVVDLGAARLPGDLRHLAPAGPRDCRAVTTTHSMPVTSVASSAREPRRIVADTAGSRRTSRDRRTRASPPRARARLRSRALDPRLAAPPDP